MVLCLFVCCLVLFFLFPRSVTLTPVSVLSVTVFFSNESVDLQVTVSNAGAVLNASVFAVRSCPGLVPSNRNECDRKVNLTVVCFRVKHLPKLCWARLCLVSQSHETVRDAEGPSASVSSNHLLNCFSSHLEESHQHHQRQLRPDQDCGLQCSGCDLEGGHRQDQDLQHEHRPASLPELGKGLLHRRIRCRVLTVIFCCSTRSKLTYQSQTRIWGEFGFDLRNIKLSSHLQCFVFCSFIHFQLLLPVHQHQHSHPVSGTAVSGIL